jgi:hypothetical protein
MSNRDVDSGQSEPVAPQTAEKKPLSPAAARPQEVSGPKGPDPVRYGDWERNGIASDF